MDFQSFFPAFRARFAFISQRRQSRRSQFKWKSWCTFRNAIKVEFMGRVVAVEAWGGEKERGRRLIEWSWPNFHQHRRPTSFTRSSRPAAGKFWNVSARRYIKTRRMLQNCKVINVFAFWWVGVLRRFLLWRFSPLPLCLDLPKIIVCCTKSSSSIGASQEAATKGLKMAEEQSQS